MNTKLINSKDKTFFLLFILLVYILITLISLNQGYFWDNIQQVSKEAHWFYQNNFRSLLTPMQNSGSEIEATGYHPPLMGLMTAFLWKIFGYNLWVSHVFILFWALILIYNLWKLINLLFPERFRGLVLLIVLLEPTVLTQFSIASPDFILFTAFIISFRSVLEKKSILLSIGIFFLCCINMRGIFVGSVLFIYQNYFICQEKHLKFKIRSILKIILPYLPTLILLSAYFVYYFYEHGWFFANATSSDHYSIPTGPGRIIRHLAEFGLRSIENGRILIWFLGFYFTFTFIRTKSKLSIHTKSFGLFFLILSCLYLLFALITQMPFSARYFMPQFFLLTILVLSEVITLFQIQKIRLILALILIFELTGNFWIYPEKIAKSWDCTLAHLPYYDLRKDCFNYIDQQKLDYKEISAGFCLYGDRKFVELKNTGKIIGDTHNCHYFIYSNISNVEDGFITELMNKKLWCPMKKFEKGYVLITIYEKILNK